ncbi:ubiquitin-conjugating enzyme/RWD-like protein [Aspergillus avenaceus]|uniref:Ubiquitin-conjugating enzyme/RWD-like protein n=1 Tax=Aspergillus avenaceus TaxID=36643 RepID=A0A5N6TUH2_ASPAV|nr:ubiquitin-conjugating enzyme/RWD-like protein [Aspergillus avenaceus]
MTHPTLLKPEHLEDQLSTLDLLTAMYPSEEELEIPSSTAQSINTLREWISDPTQPATGIPTSLLLAVRLPVSEGEKTIQVNISIPLYSEQAETLDQAPSATYSIRQPEWMSKAEVAGLTASMPADDVFEAFEYVQERAGAFLEEQAQKRSLASESVDGDSGPLVRVWFYFPSLSTREKRDDLVNHAGGFSLTGFVLAGKPGVLCLEGASGDVDAYMKFIKTHSWGDIPSHQKKVSERFRETEGVRRVFEGMQEITDSLGERSGQRANRGDMQALEAWLRDRGLHEAFENVIF